MPQADFRAGNIYKVILLKWSMTDSGYLGFRLHESLTREILKGLESSRLSNNRSHRTVY